jgi:hypothetical protein
MVECILQKVCFGKLIPNVTVLTGGTSKRWLGYESSAFMSELTLLI